MHIRNAFKSFCKARAHLLFPDIPIPARPGAPGHVEDAVLCEIVHDAIQVVAAECLQETLQKLNGHFHLFRHWGLHILTPFTFAVYMLTQDPSPTRPHSLKTLPC